MNYVAFSGGKDSTALVLRLAELGEPFECLFTPTGNELPDLTEHMERVLEMAGCPKLPPQRGRRSEISLWNSTRFQIGGNGGVRG